MNKVESTRVEKMNGEYDENQMLMETRQTLKPLRLEQDRKGMNQKNLGSAPAENGKNRT